MSEFTDVHVDEMKMITMQIVKLYFKIYTHIATMYTIYYIKNSRYIFYHKNGCKNTQKTLPNKHVLKFFWLIYSFHNTLSFFFFYNFFP